MHLKLTKMLDIWTGAKAKTSLLTIMQLGLKLWLRPNANHLAISESHLTSTAR